MAAEVRLLRLRIQLALGLAPRQGSIILPPISPPDPQLRLAREFLGLGLCTETLAVLVLLALGLGVLGLGVLGLGVLAPLAVLVLLALGLGALAPLAVLAPLVLVLLVLGLGVLPGQRALLLSEHQSLPLLFLLTPLARLAPPLRTGALAGTILISTLQISGPLDLRLSWAGMLPVPDLLAQSLLPRRT